MKEFFRIPMQFFADPGDGHPAGATAQADGVQDPTGTAPQGDGQQQTSLNTTAIAGKADAADLTALAAEVDTKADESDLTTATASLQAQIDAIVTPVTQDAEVQNARVDVSGTTYASLKNRLDTENTALNNRCTDLASGNVFPMSLNADRLSFVDTANLFDFDSTQNEDGYINSLGKILAHSSYKTSHMIAVKPNTTYYFGGGYNETYNYKFAYKICEFDADGKTVTNYESDVPESHTVSSNTHYVRFTYRATAVSNRVYWGENDWNGTSAPAYNPQIPSSFIKGGTALAEVEDAKVDANETAHSTLKARLDSDYTATTTAIAAISNVNADINKLYNGKVFPSTIDISKLSFADSVNMFDFESSENVDGYPDDTGNIHESSSYRTSHMIAVKPNTTYYFGGGHSGTYGYKFARFICEYDADGKTVTNFGTNVAENITVTANTHYVRFTYGSSATSNRVYWGKDDWNGTSAPAYNPQIPHTYIRGFNTIIDANKYISASGNLTSGSVLKIDTMANSIRKNEVFAFTGDIITFDSLEIGVQDTPSTKRNRIVITSTKLKIYNYSGSSNEYEHGLTIKDNIQVNLETNDVYGITVTIVSCGEMFKHTYTGGEGWNRRYVAYPYAESTGSTINNCKLSWTCKDFNKNIWIFGDSYLGYSNKWSYYLHQFGYDSNVLLDSFPGEDGLESTTSFENLLNIAKPKVAIYCLGMNDGTDDVSYSQTWKTSLDKFLLLCQNNGIKPILATIPTVPNINHEQKNAWIRSSGYRYIDFAQAVGASSSGVWYDDMLGSDEVHPTDKGAKALFMRAITDAPEITVTC